VQTLAGLGVRQAEIAGLLRCDAKTLRKYYRNELDTGATRANLAVAQSLFDNATRHNNVTAQVWWTRSRMGWKTNEVVVGNGGGAQIVVLTEVQRDDTPMIEGEAASDAEDDREAGHRRRGGG
jgi:hypothetical protein